MFIGPEEPVFEVTLLLTPVSVPTLPPPKLDASAIIPFACKPGWFVVLLFTNLESNVVCAAVLATPSSLRLYVILFIKVLDEFVCVKLNI